MPAKFCVFCGKRPDGKNKEHVLPHWLLELTGDPTRPANFGLDLSQGMENAKLRRYAFSQFQFPSCEICNNIFSDLEGKAKAIVLKLLTPGDLVPRELSILLDWFDKIRIGLWLGYHQLDKNFEQIRLRFYISDRIGRKDRLLVLAFRSDKRELLSFIGPNLLAFRFAPVALGLIINGLCFVNISCDYLLARRLGFPYPRSPIISVGSQKRDYCELGAGLGRVLRPNYAAPLQLPGAMYCQPMFPSEMTSPARPLYENDYVRAHSLDWTSGVGGICYSKGDRFHWLDAEGTHQAAEFCRNGAENKMVLSVISALKYLNTRGGPDYRHRTPADRNIINTRLEASLWELGIFEQMIRSSPDRSWVSGPGP
jgi:hypothetical protein